MKLIDILFFALLLLGMPKLPLFTRRKVAVPMLLMAFFGLIIGAGAIVRLLPRRFVG